MSPSRRDPRRPDVTTTACRTLDFHRAAEMIALGRERALEALERHGLLDADGGAEAP